MAQPALLALTTNPDDPSVIPKTHMQKRTDYHKLSSDDSHTQRIMIIVALVLIVRNQYM